MAKAALSSALLFLILASSCWCEDGKIVGGTNANIEDFPYQVSFRYQGSHFCGGSIYNENWIVTASHCVADFQNADGLSVVAGITHLDDSDGQSVEVQQFFANPKYDKSSTDYDVALLKLKSPLVFDNKVKSIPLSDRTPRSREIGLVSGWGTTRRGGGGDVSNDLLFTEVRVQNPVLCQIQYLFKLTGRMFCAGYVFGGRDSCQGDSGGPLLIDGKLSGVVSFGRGCADSFSPGVYTDVSKVRDFIEPTIQQN